jgi:transcriptional regulator with XRE-family HTH domain
MGSREHPVERAVWRMRRTRVEVLAELRDARLDAGLSQELVARAIGISRPSLSRLERGTVADLPLGMLARFAGAVDRDLVIRVYPGSGGVRDAAQLRVLDRTCARLGTDWGWRREVPLPEHQDQRAWDAVGTHRGTGLMIWVEAESRIRDVQALVRRLMLKRRDGRATRLIVVVNDSRHTRTAIRAEAAALREAFPAHPRRSLAALSRGLDPGADCLLIL